MESTEKKSIGLNLKATELRLGLPGSESPERDVSLVVCGAKRAFSEAPRSITNQQTPFSPASLLPKPLHHDNNKPHLSVLATKAQVVGWPPIRSFRKNSMSSQAPHKDDTDADAEAEAKSGCLYVKVSMEGAPYLRKVDLNSFSTYRELSSALEKMFSCFTISSYGVSCRENLSESKLMDLLHGSEYVLTYEDKDGDWMLVGDVPWEMFIDSCKRLRIKKSSEAIGLAPRAMEKCKSHNFHNVICNLSTDP